MKSSCILQKFIKEHPTKNFSSEKFWADMGIIHDIKNEKIKEKVLKAIELAAEIIKKKLDLGNFSLGNKLRDETDNFVFIMVRGAIVGIDGEPKLNDSFEFDELSMNEFINYVSDCLDTYNYSKYIDFMDVEAETMCFLIRMYVISRNNRIKHKTKNKL